MQEAIVTFRKDIAASQALHKAMQSSSYSLIQVILDSLGPMDFIGGFGRSYTVKSRIAGAPPQKAHIACGTMNTFYRDIDQLSKPWHQQHPEYMHDFVWRGSIDEPA